MLKEYGVVNLHNFWCLLRTTWLRQIDIQYKGGKYTSYYRHIETGNNSDLDNLSISSTLEQQIFFTTLSLVLKVTFLIHHIHQATSLSKSINACDMPNHIKTINYRKSIQGDDIFEPWIAESVLQSSHKVCLVSHC